MRQQELRAYVAECLQVLIAKGHVVPAPSPKEMTLAAAAGAVPDQSGYVDVSGVVFAGVAMKNVHIWQTNWSDGLQEMRIECTYPWTIGPRVKREVAWGVWVYNVPHGEPYWKLDGESMWVNVYKKPSGITKILEDWEAHVLADCAQP